MLYLFIMKIKGWPGEKNILPVESNQYTFIKANKLILTKNIFLADY